MKWTRTGETFTDGRYSRAHVWRFDGGAEVRASAAPEVVRPPFSDPAGVDPEEALVAALSSCHMLWFLSLAARRGFVVDDYTDDAVGVMGKSPEGRMMMTTCTLRPAVRFAGERRQEPRSPAHEKSNSEDALAPVLSRRTRSDDFIANSVKTGSVRSTVESHVPPSAPDRPCRAAGPRDPRVIAGRSLIRTRQPPPKTS